MNDNKIIELRKKYKYITKDFILSDGDYILAEITGTPEIYLTECVRIMKEQMEHAQEVEQQIKDERFGWEYDYQRSLNLNDEEFAQYKEACKLDNGGKLNHGKKYLVSIGKWTDKLERINNDEELEATAKHLLHKSG